jgi:hypothetical protein
MGKGGPPSQEHDVRLVYAKVVGARILGASVEDGTLFPSPTDALNPRWGSVREGCAPRFDSSDSEAGEDAYPVRGQWGA